MIKIGDYNTIMSDRKLFQKTVYTSLLKAIKILEKRQNNSELIKKVEKILNKDIPEPLRKIEKYGVSEKQVATPNWDTRWFISLTKEFKLKPIFSEYYNDKFTSNNEFKHSLGQIHICKGVYKNGEDKSEKITIVDFNLYNGKKIKDVKTLWGEPLIEFHKRLFEAYKYNKNKFIFYDASDWLNRNGGEAKDYYEKDLLLYICHGILFENFLLTGSEGEFTRDVVLPAFKKVVELIGMKPLIVPIPPMDMEHDQRWISYDKKVKDYIKLN